MTQTSYVNPNGLPAEGQITSARDLAILARAIIRDLPEYEYFVHIPAIRFGRRTTQQFQQADRPLSRRRRLQDRLHLRVRLQSGGVGDARRQAADRGRARLVLRPGARGARRAAAGARLRQQRAGLAEALARHRRQSGADRRHAAEPARRDVRRQAQAARHRRGRRHDNGRPPVGESPALAFFAAGLQAPMAKPSELLAAAYTAGEPIVVYTGPKQDRRGPDRRRGRG